MPEKIGSESHRQTESMKRRLVSLDLLCGKYIIRHHYPWSVEVVTIRLTLNLGGQLWGWFQHLFSHHKVYYGGVKCRLEENGGNRSSSLSDRGLKESLRCVKTTPCLASALHVQRRAHKVDLLSVGPGLPQWKGSLGTAVQMSNEIQSGRHNGFYFWMQTVNTSAGSISV